MRTDGHDEANSLSPQFRARTKELTQEPVPAPLCPPQILRRSTTTRVVQHTQLTFRLTTYWLCLVPGRGAASTLLLIDARTVKPTVVTFCPDNDSTGRNNCCRSSTKRTVQFSYT